jgi:hypothetical protein
VGPERILGTGLFFWMVGLCPRLELGQCRQDIRFDVARIGQVQAIDSQAKQPKTIRQVPIAVIGCCVTRRRTLFRPGFVGARYARIRRTRAGLFDVNVMASSLASI